MEYLQNMDSGDMIKVNEVTLIDAEFSTRNGTTALIAQLNRINCVKSLIYKNIKRSQSLAFLCFYRM